MFKRIELACFRQHKERTFDLENGIVALRGANEAGKTTILEAIGYAWFGPVAFRKGDTLADVVTWGHKETQLKVRTHCALNGVDYFTKRGKSGAEVTDISGKVLATGHSEVRKFWEALLGASAETCANLMMADQTSLRGVLLEGPGAAIKLIEKLSNFSLIDTIIALVQGKLPCGTTTAVEARIAMLAGQVEQPVQDDSGPLQFKVDEAEVWMQIKVQERDLAKLAYGDVQDAARAAQESVETHRRALLAVENAKQRLDTATMTLESIVPIPGPAESEITELRKQAADAQRFQRAVEAKVALGRLPEPENEWEGDNASFQEAWADLQREIRGDENWVSEYRQMLARLQTQLITETACGLCGKDLKDVPEVRSKNAATQEKIDTAQSELKDILASLAEKTAESDAFMSILNADRARQRAYTQYAEFIALDHGYVPARWSWTGPDLMEPLSGQVLLILHEAEGKVTKYQRDLGRQAQAKLALEAAETVHREAVSALAEAEKPLENAKVVLEDAAAKTAALNAAEEALRNSQQALQIALQALNQTKAVLAERQRAREAVVAQLEEAKKELVSMNFNNDLIKRLRDARPDIANELWGIMASSVSKVFSDIRGTPSVFTREDGGFKVDGHSVNSLSGSALDALGLAIRITSTRTFLPNTRFLNLDEPAAACDDGRESNMLGVIASSEFDQVILVTHSEAAQSFASQVIQL